MEQRFILSRQTDLEIDYTLFDIHNALVIDNTGAFTTHEALSRHLVSKADKVLLTAPGKGVQILYGA
jgi:glyceraldehyde 3-phosphate dehydrogenase